MSIERKNGGLANKKSLAKLRVSWYSSYNPFTNDSRNEMICEIGHAWNSS